MGSYEHPSGGCRCVHWYQWRCASWAGDASECGVDVEEGVVGSRGAKRRRGAQLRVAVWIDVLLVSHNMLTACIY